MKSQERIRAYWKKILASIILNSLLYIFVCTLGCLSLAAEAVEAGQVKHLAEVAPTEKILRDLEETRKELQDLRQRYTELFLRNREMQKELLTYKMLFNSKCLNLEDIASNGSSKMLEMLTKEAVNRQQLKQNFLLLREKIVLMLNTSTIKIEVKEMVLKELDELTEMVAQKLSPEKKIEPASQSTEVLDVNEELNVAIIDGGKNNGYQPGMVFISTERDKVLISLQIVEVRAEVSAVVVVSGRIKDLGPGMRIKLRE